MCRTKKRPHFRFPNWLRPMEILWGQRLRYYSSSFACKNLYILAVYKCEKRAFQSYNPVLFWYIFLTWEIYSQVSEAHWIWAEYFMVFFTWQAARRRKYRPFFSLAGLARLARLLSKVLQIARPKFCKTFEMSN